MNEVGDLRTLLEAASPAVLVTYRSDGSALASPVWFRWHDDAFEVVIAEGDIKLRHLERHPECALTVFETQSPFRGIEVRGTPDILAGDVSQVRAAIAGRYLGRDAGERFATERTRPGQLLRLAAHGARTWDLSAILPS